MADQLGRFRTPEDAARYLDVYDAFVERHWRAPREELDVPTQFGPTRVRRTGSGEATPLVFLHPTSGGSLGLHSLVGPLAEQRPVYTPDTIGTIGRSIQTAPVRTAEDLVTWLDDALDALSLSSIHLAGFSEGGWIAGLHAALTRTPQRLASLTLIEPGGAIERISATTLAGIIARATSTLLARDKPKAIRRFNRWLSGDIEISDDELELVLLAFGKFRQKLPTPKRLADDQLTRITAPTLVLLGADSRLYDPNKVATRARQHLRDVTVEITPNAGHGLPLQYLDQITSRILEFLTNHEPTNSPM